MKNKDAILVTGAAGFIGMHCTKNLLELGYKVLGIDNLNDYYDPRLKLSRLNMLTAHSQFEFLEADILEINELSFPNIRPTKILHLAAQAGVRHSITNPDAYVQSNLVGFSRMLEFSRRNNITDFVYASSSSVYGNSDSTPFHESDKTEEPVSLYAATKKSNELLAHSYAHLYGIHCTGLRFFTVYGPWGRPDMAPFLFTEAVLEDRPINLFNNGNMLRDFTYIDDISEAVTRVLLAPKNSHMGFASGGTFKKTTSGGSFRILNIGNNSPIRLTEFIAAIEKATGKSAKRVMKPMQPGDVERTCASSEAIAEWVGFQPKTTIDDGISKFTEWLVKHRAQP